MRSYFRAFLLLTTAFLALSAFGQKNHFRWSAELVEPDARPGEAARVVLTLELDEGWHAYQIGQQGGPLGIEAKLQNGPLEEIAPIVVPEPKKKFDKAFKVEVGYYEKLAKFAIPVRLKEGLKGAQTAKVEVKTQVCDEAGCDRPRTETVEVKFAPGVGEMRPEFIAANTKLPDQPSQNGKSQQEGKASANSSSPADPATSGTLWGIFLTGFAGGLLALLTPCVFPMIPVTISFFSKQGGDRKKHVRAALLYCAGIVVSFTGLGLLVTALLGKNGTYILASNLWVNGALVVLFVVLALSLFGVLELLLPSGTLTKVTNLTQRGGAVAGPLLMGLTFALTSFTCTVPVVGALLAGAATGGTLHPAVGMIGFSTALALPFLLLAIFPSLMKSLPKSGSWMVTAKVFMGFLELAAAMKFLSNIDLVLKLGFLTRPVFLAIWAAIFVLAGLHLFGWIRLPHDFEGKVGPTRRLIGAATIAAAWYCLMGINGASLGVVTGLLPPSDYPTRLKTSSTAENGELSWIRNDLPKAKALAIETGKPLLIDFTGYT